MKKSQKQLVLEHLFTFGTISTIECFELYRITDLQHSIYELRKEGYVIKDKWEKSKNKLGWANKYKRYFFEEV